MQFTPQQLVGAGRYAPATRIGNWNEDLMLEEARLKEFQLRKAQGSLLATHKLKHDFLHQEAPRSLASGSASIRLNDAVGIGHIESNGQLACNVFEETPSIGSGEYIVTVATAVSLAVARTTFRLLSPASLKETQASGRSLDLSTPGSPLRYGEPFVIMCNEALLVDDQSVLLKPPLFLKTGLKTERSMSPITYNQRVWLGQDADSAALWICERADLSGTERFLAAGGDVAAGDRIAIVHKMTGQPLFAESGNKQPTDFGVELEACSLAAKTAGKHHHLVAEAKGVRTPDTEARSNLAPNAWTFLLATSPQDARDTRMLPSFASPTSVVYVLQRCLLAQSLYAFRRFLVGITKLDARGSGHVQREDAKWFIQTQKLPLRDDHADVLFDAFDKRSTGHFPLQELLAALRPAISAQRREWIHAAFEKLVRDVGTAGKLTLSHLVQHYDPTVDARVRGNQLTLDAARAEYRDLFMHAQTEVTSRAFEDVYTDIAAAIENDALFAQLLAESWQ